MEKILRVNLRADVPLAEAWLLWTPPVMSDGRRPWGAGVTKGCIVCVSSKELREHNAFLRNFYMSAEPGRYATDAENLLHLYCQIATAGSRDGVNFLAACVAAYRVPEFRSSLAHDNDRVRAAFEIEATRRGT